MSTEFRAACLPCPPLRITHARLDSSPCAESANSSCDVVDCTAFSL
eukprot:CAMPEP_0179342210 /NCGR_PEP_ID=MMETSP0797-20121207/70278_1 /TAXON_ID=47934 /ORGANISM="Dinophysis acuminata, Strain DAEP01" /LENGTH=45 /DNA_ID= /DNA_START= /DNA_END= /DNA_ORIENTATION=